MKKLIYRLLDHIFGKQLETLIERRLRMNDCNLA